MWIRGLIACLTAGLLTGCAINTRVTDTGCLWTRTITVSQADVLSDGTARQILAHNETRERVCQNRGDDPAQTRMDARP